jgi:hypothetical protein
MRDELDRLIDDAVASYSDVEPRLGLEARVLNRMHVLRARRRIFAWGMGLAVAASVVVVGIVIRTEQRPTSKPAEVARVTRAEEPTPTTRPVAKVRPAKRARRPQFLPKLEQFPAPTPLTAEERALIAFAQLHPRDAEMFAELQKQADEPVEIERIRIAPLQSEGAQ